MVMPGPELNLIKNDVSVSQQPDFNQLQINSITIGWERRLMRHSFNNRLQIK